MLTSDTESKVPPTLRARVHVSARLQLHARKHRDAHVLALAEARAHAWARGAQVAPIVLCCVQREEAALAMTQKVFKRMFETQMSLGRLHTQVSATVLARINSACSKAGRPPVLAVRVPESA